VSRSSVESKGASAFRERARFSFGHGSLEVRARRRAALGFVKRRGGR
jgi:hypothetical protein